MTSNGSDHGAHAERTPPPLLPRTTQRERLLDGMARAVARRGYAATTVADVLGTAGVSRRTFYEQFADKEDCFLAAYDAFAQLCVARASAAFRAGEEPRQQLAQGVRALLEALAAEPEFARLGIVEVLAAGPHAVARRNATLGRLVRCIEGSRSGGDAGPVAPDVVAQAIAGGMYELVYARIAESGTVGICDLADELVGFAAVLLGAERPTG